MSEKKQWKFVSLRMSSKLDKTFRTAHLSHLEHHSSFWAREKMLIFFAPNELKTWQNVQNCSVKPFESITVYSELEKKMKCFFAPNELKTWQTIHNGSVKTLGASQLILSEKKQWKFVSLRMSSKLDKTFRTAQLSQLEHHSSFWARKSVFIFIRSEWDQNLTKRSERLI